MENFKTNNIKLMEKLAKKLLRASGAPKTVLRWINYKCDAIEQKIDFYYYNKHICRIGLKSTLSNWKSFDSLVNELKSSLLVTASQIDLNDYYTNEINKN